MVCFLTKSSWQIQSKANKILVVLDLDETLIHATKSPSLQNWSFEVGPYKVAIRPGLDEFLAGLRSHFNVAVWSSASDDYVLEVVRNIFLLNYPLEFVWGRSRCTLKQDFSRIEAYGYSDPYNHLSYVKPLQKVAKKGFARLENMLIIDDTPSKSRYNYGNAIYPSEFTGDPEDMELAALLKYLLTLKDVTNVRTIEKRSWRDRV